MRKVGIGTDYYVEYHLTCYKNKFGTKEWEDENDIVYDNPPGTQWFTFSTREAAIDFAYVQMHKTNSEFTCASILLNVFDDEAVDSEGKCCPELLECIPIWDCMVVDDNDEIDLSRVKGSELLN